jgi:hypothetical protein
MSVAIPSRLVRKHSFSENRGPAPANHHLTINVVLKIQNAEWLEKKVHRPTHRPSPPPPHLTPILPYRAVHKKTHTLALSVHARAVEGGERPG